MKDLAGKTAVVTGAASGIGRALALAFGAEGMNVVVSDIEQSPAEAVAADVRALGVRALAVKTDVADRASVQALADAAFAEFGAVHVLCNNAGVLVFKPLAECTDADWQWLVGVNLWGVVNGIQAFLPRLRAQGGGAHIVNTASIAGHFAGATGGIGIYTTTKFAVVGLSESLRAELEPEGIGVTVLCPGGVATRISDAARNRPERFGGPQPAPARERPAGATGLAPETVAQMVLDGIRRNAAYVFTDPASRIAIEGRLKKILAAFE
jgi:NAD(P)-dependent dehydrogenase (short-subunit alcohol dehydrogenase family)